MRNLSDSSNIDQVFEYIEKLFLSYPGTLSSEEVASKIVDLGRFDWSHTLSKTYESYNSMASLANDMEYQEQPGDWNVFQHYFNAFKRDILSKREIDLANQTDRLKKLKLSKPN